ncbi:hypothetical protein [Thermanaeromonas sp. C210]|uniref:hypothetical protein n=1 Tax=Thermanaeromonas sp. C210 TaxID=2731925 RepID=UPI00155C20C6|nr:hypothetical protein [Thermanaeromonas sp. C210]GFN22172.1 hypothetical protein TAMC210_04880 [Thermanaeromonas sp. C210]
MFEFLENIGKRIKDVATRVAQSGTAKRVSAWLRSISAPRYEAKTPDELYKQVRKEAEAYRKAQVETLTRAIERLPARLRSVAYGALTVPDYAAFGAFRSREVGQKLIERGALTPQAEKTARAVGEVLGVYLPFAGASRLLRPVTRIIAAESPKLGRIAAAILEGALGGAWLGVEESKRKGQPTAQWVQREAVSGALWAGAGAAAGEKLMQAGSKLLQRAGGSPALEQIRRVMHEWVIGRKVAENKPRMFESLLQKAAGGDEGLLNLAHLARAWLKDPEFLDPQHWRTTLASRISQVEQKAAQAGNLESAAFLRSLREKLPTMEDATIQRLARATQDVHSLSERLNRVLTRLGLEETWQHPQEIYVPRYVAETALAQRGAQPTGSAAGAMLARRPHLFSPHQLPRQLSLEEALVKFKPQELTLDVSKTLPLRISEHQRLLENVKFLNRIRALASREYAPGVKEITLPGELRSLEARRIKELGQQAARGAKAAAKALERETGHLYLPADAAKWLEGRLAAMYHSPGPAGRAWQEVMRQTTRLKVYLPWDWVSQMVFGAVGPAKDFVTALNPVARFAYAWRTRQTGAEALQKVSPELAKLVEAGLDIGGSDWHRRTLEAATKPVREPIARLWRTIESRVLEPVETMAFGPTIEMRTGLALDLFKRFTQQGKPESEAAKTAAHLANFLTGSVMTEMLDPTAQKALRYFFLAPKWLTHTLQLPFRAAGLVTEPALSPEARELAQRFLAGYLMNNVLANFILANALNRRINNGRNIWENPPGYRHLVDITPLVGLGPQGQRQYFDPWFFWRDYPRLLQYIMGEVRPERYFVYKLAPLVAVAADAAGYDLSTGQVRPMGLEERIRATVKDMVSMLLPAGTLEIPGAGLSAMGGWSATPTGRFDLPRQIMEWVGLRTFPGQRPVQGRGTRLLPEEQVRMREAMRQGVLGVRRDSKGVIRFALTKDWYYWLARVLGKAPSEEETIEAVLDVLGLPPDVRDKALRNIFSPESVELFRKYFRANPTPRGLWMIRTILAQDNHADRERVLQRLLSQDNLNWLAEKLGRWPTVEDVLRYHKTMLQRELPDVAALGTGATARRALPQLLGR